MRGRVAWVLVAWIGWIAGASWGCELVATVDRSQIPGGGGSPGAGGSGGETTSPTGGGTAGSGGSGGAGAPCETAFDCEGLDDECQHRICKAGHCGTAFEADGTPVATQTEGDCQQVVCDGAGAQKTIDDATDVPDDQNPCTVDQCDHGVPKHVPGNSGMSCGGPGLVCDDMGHCTGCNQGTECPGTDDDCSIRTCDAGHICGRQYAPDGTPLSQANQVDGDCHAKVCDGAGHTRNDVDDTDAPDDNKDCTDDACNNGSPSHTPKTAGASCNDGGGRVCNANGKCVECLMASNCPAGTECRAPACMAGTCGFTNVAAGTPLVSQTSGDCQKAVCDGNGGTTTAIDDTDLPVDGNSCTNDVCSGGVASNPPRAAGTACGTSGVCDGSGHCVGCTQASDCGMDTECTVQTCVANVCGTSDLPAGTPTATQTPGDCHRSQCDGSGNVVVVVDDTDVPVDSLQCTRDVCTAGVPSNPPEAQGASCTEGGGHVCDGNGACVDCVDATTCPGQETDCQTRTCNGNMCGLAFAPPGTPVGSALQTPGDCHTVRCNGSGGTTNAIDNSDLPVDGNACTNDVCTAGVPSNPPVPAGTPCGASGVCNASGVCIGCTQNSDCGTDTECTFFTCTSNTCSTNFRPVGTPTTAQTPGDCHENQCDGAGGIVNVVDDGDLPVDGNQCTQDVCTNGAPSNPNSPPGTACSQNGGSECDGAGDCLQCLTAADCGADNACRTYSCTAGACSHVDEPPGFVIASQTAGDCHQNRCDGAGNIVNAIDDTDLPVDGLQCTQDVCTSGVPSNPPQPAGTACSQSGGNVCSTVGVCTRLFDVLRVGDGSAALTSAATAAFLEQRFLSDGALFNPGGTNPLALPTVATVAPAPAALTLSGTATSEGQLSQSADGHFLVLAGYNATVGTASVTSSTSATVNRVAGRIDAARAVDTSTRLDALCSGNNVRSAATDAGSDIWVGCAASGAVYLPFQTTGGTQLEATFANVRGLQILAGNLYASSGTAAAQKVFQIGSGLPTTSGQTTSPFPGITGGGSPTGFRLFDLTAPAGADRMYIADNGAVASPATDNSGGIQRWTFDGTNWTRTATFTTFTTPTGPATSAFTQLAAFSNGGNITIIATTSSSPSVVVVFVDDGVTTPTGLQVVAAPTNTFYKGIALSAQ